MSPPPSPAPSRLVLGIDPGLLTTGWGVVHLQGPVLTYVAAGTLRPNAQADMPTRLAFLYQGLTQVLATHAPQGVGMEDTFMNSNPQSSLKLGLARGALLAALGNYSLTHPASIAFYAPNAIKKAVTGQGHADKTQMLHMVQRSLKNMPTHTAQQHDEIDALAIAVCHGLHTRLPARP